MLQVTAGLADLGLVLGLGQSFWVMVITDQGSKCPRTEVTVFPLN